MSDSVAAAIEAYRDGKTLFTYIDHKVDYAKNLESNYTWMRNEASKLYARRDDYKDEVKKDRGKKLKKECEIWFKKVVQIEAEVQELESKYKNHQSGWHLFWSNSKLSKKFVEMCAKLQSIRENGKFETGIMVEKLPECVKKIHGPKIEADTSLHGVVQELVDSLRDGDITRIGVWGIPGIGKTTILQNLNDDKSMEEMFDIVIWVTVSENWSIKEVQHAIANRLGLNTKACTEVETAHKISEELENKKYLLLLDDVWRNLDLHAIGIRDNQKDGKMVLATRYRHICYDMEADKLISVKRLSDGDAWKMFSRKVGQSINLPSIKPIAQLVVMECVGLPLLIDRVAIAFRRKNQDVRLWEYGLSKLRYRISIQDQGMNETLEVLKFCYEELDGEDKKNCFLYCALYPEDCEISIDYLLECWNAEGFLHGDRLLRDARGRGHEILDDLIKVSLLERVDNTKYIKMNKVLRNMALRISSQREIFDSVVRPGEGLKEPPTEEEWERANRISLMDNELYSLPESPNCRSLITLLLQRNRSLEVIPKHFFQSMNHLRVLDLHGTAIKSLPATMFHLISLKALYLNSCHNLTKFPLIKKGHLHLEVLDIRGTGINNIPLVVGTFSQLKCLRMSLSNSVVGHLDQEQLPIARINCNVISRVALLEELSIDVNSHNHRWNEVVMAITLEVASLRHLVSLSFCFPEVDCLKTFTTKSSLWKNLHSFMFHVGYHDSKRYRVLEFFGNQIYRRLKYANGHGVDQAISEVLAVTEAFELINHKEVFSLSDFGIQSMNTMRGCLIERCNEIETIIDGHTITEGVLRCLEKMYIYNVPNLISIWEGPVHAGSLVWLTTLNLLRCDSLKKIFSNGLIQHLSQLQDLRVEECAAIEELIMVSENIALLPDALPRLKTLVLIDLPKLTSIWAGDQSLEWPSLERIQVLSCNLLMRLPFHNDNATILKSIEGEETWWSSLEWKDQSAEQRLRSICTLN